MIAWRICKAKRAATALSGEGAARFPGRWNSARHPVVYLGQSRALAALELLVHVEDLALLGGVSWVAVPVEFADDLVSAATRLPADWDAVPAPAGTRALGDRWLESGRSAVLRVPSVVVRGEFNYLLNPAHPDFARIKAGPPEVFKFDQRLRFPRSPA